MAEGAFRLTGGGPKHTSRSMQRSSTKTTAPISASVLAATMVVSTMTGWAHPADAQQVPRLVPDRDVTVDYEVQPRDAPRQEVRISIAAGGRRLRISAQDLPATFLIDRATATATILVPLLKSYTSTNVARYDPEATVLRHARYTRLGSETIAGLGCTNWAATSSQGNATACITNNGVILKGEAADRHGRIGTMVASTVAFGELDPAAFRLPEDYRFIGDLPPGLLGVGP